MKAHSTKSRGPHMPLLAIEDSTINAIGAVMGLLITGLSIAYVRLRRTNGAERRANRAAETAAHTVETEEEIRKEEIVWKRLNSIVRRQGKQLEDQDTKITKLLDEVSKYRVEAAECKERERSYELRIQDLEERLGMKRTEEGADSKEHKPLEGM
jgi:predicted RNase H-like nuclease (RuvC/YqgF family)